MRRLAKILHAPTTVGGNPQGLARAERALGADSVSMCVRQNVYNYPADIVILTGNESMFLTELKKWKFFYKSLHTYDIFHFNFGCSLTPPLFGHLSSPMKLKPLRRILWESYAHLISLVDLPLLRRMNKIIFVTYQGDDARQGMFTLRNFSYSIARELKRSYYDPLDDCMKRLAIKKFSRYAHRIYSLNPDLLWVLPKDAEFIPYAHFDVNESEQIPPSVDGPIKVAHAPTHRGAKGTKYFIQAVERLISEGYQIEPIIIDGMSHKDALKAFARADLLMDQVLAGWYGGVAVEFMAMGKPVISYIRETDLRFIPEQMRSDIPIINANPANLHDVIKKVVTMSRADLRAIGQRSRDYVLKWHDPLKIASRILKDYRRVIEEKNLNLRVTRNEF